MSKKRVTLAERNLAEAYRKLLLMPEGRLVLRDLLAQTGLLAPSCGPVGNSFTNGSETFWREGRRSIGLGLVSRLNEITPHAYAGLAHESANEMVETAPQRADEEDDG